MSDETLVDRARAFLALLRGDVGTPPPPGAQIASSPALASALGLPGMGSAGAVAGGAAGARGLGAVARGATAGALSSVALIGHETAPSAPADPLVRAAATKFSIGDMGGARTLLDRRLEQNQDDEFAWRLRAFVLWRMKDYARSASDARAALRLAPGDSRARRMLIDDEVNLGRPQEALREADAALERNPNDAQVLAARADVWASVGDRGRQLADLRQAAVLDAQFDGLYKEAALGGAAPAMGRRMSRRPRATVVWLGTIGTALLFLSFALYRRRGGPDSTRLALREEDHRILARGGRPEAVPAGFRIVKTLGLGGMGIVYEAVDLGLQRTVAIKKLRAEVADIPRERERFLKEARMVAALKHPNIIEIHSIHEDEEGLFLVFERVPGETLHELLGRGALVPAQAVAYLRQIALALDCAHAAGVVHQDLKPGNVMIAGDTAKVMDFGIARRVAETMSTLSKMEVSGTPAYMAPEQERGGNVGPEADVFALGTCAYEVLTGRPPFPNGGAMMKAEKMYRPASELAAGLSPAVDAAIGRALEPEPSARWPTASSFVEALGRALAA